MTRPTNRKTTDGFTLIEVLLYVGIFSLIMSGLLLTVYNMIQGSSRLQSKVAINEEGAFIVRKLDWALTGASVASVISPDMLRITNPSLPPGDNPLVLSLSLENLILTRGFSSQAQLNSDSVKMTSLVFTEVFPPLGGKVGIRAQFTLENLSRSQTFDVIKYLRL